MVPTQTHKNIYIRNSKGTSKELERRGNSDSIVPDRTNTNKTIYIRNSKGTSKELESRGNSDSIMDGRQYGADYPFGITNKLQVIVFLTV